MNVPSNAEEEE